MPVIPVQYESLKAILQYMDPNTRFQISLRIPSISSLERRIPLKIKNLTFSQIDTKVNEVSYRLGVYRDYGRNETPPDALLINQGGGSDDIDQYGVFIYPGENNVLPGDIDLRIRIQQYDRFITEEEEQNLVQDLRIFKILLAERLNEEYIEDNETRNAVVGGPWNAFMETKYREIVTNRSVEFIQSWIQLLRDRLSGFTNRRNNQNRPYTPWIQLSVYSPKGVTIQRVAYNKYLYEAKKAVHTKLFGNRGSNISGKNLKIELPNRILRFPAATILRIENLEVVRLNSLAFERFKNIIHPSSLPIQQLKVSSIISTDDFRHTIAREAKRLIINNLTTENGSWTPILQSLTNERVCLMNENERVPPNNYMDLIENWLESGRPIGTTFLLGIKNEETVKQCLDILRQRQEVLGSSEKQVQLRIDASLMLNVSYEMINQRGRIMRNDQSKWWLRLSVVRGSSD
ncbi:hypothetical protein GCK72_004368 [Caenorhabditis remanei]|uniref:F-box domain-containing protein n=1 Tax=Caenorhabditis remanei TaxID=31234 RepID=A0A6A5H9C1_CAERE|nr:hypothetical protein GCK72_004368 [Caenorhabditis remanei]KAF1764420.1 hypothetical protein GCK72_004368 [Caenorhabditis remanei]